MGSVEAKTLRVCIVTETYPPEINGVATPCSNWWRGWSSGGIGFIWFAPTRKANERLRLHGGRGVPEKINPRYLGRLRHPGHLPVGAAESVTHESDDGWRETLVLGLPIPSYPNLRFGLPVYRRFRRMWCKAPLDAIYIATQGPLGHGPSRPLAPTTFPR